MLYEIILDKFELEFSRAKVNVTLAILRKLNPFLHSSPFIYGPILILLHTTVIDDNILDKIEYQHSRAKVKITVAIFRKTIIITLSPSFMDRF